MRIICKSELKPKLFAFLFPKTITLHDLAKINAKPIPIIEYKNKILTSSHEVAAKLPLIQDCIFPAPTPLPIVNICDKPPKRAFIAAPARTILIVSNSFL